MRKILLPVSLLLLAGCATTSAPNTETFADVTGVGAARQQCVSLMRPYIPAGTPSVADKLRQLPDNANGQKVFSQAINYRSTGKRVDAVCIYAVTDDSWKLSRFVLTPKPPRPTPAAQAQKP